MTDELLQALTAIHETLKQIEKHLADIASDAADHGMSRH